jgi:hypothetical protein
LDDAVYFGTSTSGAVYRWTESGGVLPLYASPQNSVYALQAAPDGSLIAATGEKALSISFVPVKPRTTPTGARILEPTQSQALSLAIAPGGDLLVGTGNNAAAYRAALGNVSGGSLLPTYSMLKT